MREVIKRKQKEVEGVYNKIKGKNVYVANLERIPTNLIKRLKNELKEAELIIRPKNILRRALEKANIKELIPHLQGQVCLVVSEVDPFKLSLRLKAIYEESFVKKGMKVKEDVVLPEGPTLLMPGPEMTELSEMGVPVNPKGGKVNILKPTTILKKGEVASKKIADLLFKIGIKPVKLYLELISAYENGIIFTREQLDFNAEEYINKLVQAYQNATNLSFNAKIINKSTIETFLREAFNHARNLAIEANIITKETAGDILSLAHAKAKALKEKINWR